MSDTPDRGPDYPGMTPSGIFGISLRDWLAGEALIGLLAGTRGEEDAALIASQAYAFADSMLEARGQR